MPLIVYLLQKGVGRFPRPPAGYAPALNVDQRYQPGQLAP